MDSYPEVTPLWDLAQNPDLSQLADSDFLALLQKHFPAGNGAPLGFTGTYIDGVNPQNLSTFSLPSLTPPSEDSSPSPSNSNQDATNDDSPDPALKRKASDEDLSDGPSQKAQHISSDKRGPASASAATRRKSSGSTGKDETRLMKRKEQNRAAQRAFRERKEKHVKDLEDKVADLEAKNEQAQHENENLRDLLTRLQSENLSLKQSSFTFSVPKNAASALEPRSPHNHFATAPSAPSIASSSTSNHASPKMTNPLEWSSLTTFDPAVLNLLDDSVPQPTATEGAMQMDFGFGGNTGLASNAPYTTIASNPMFMSFASTFDNQSPADASSSTPASASGSNNFPSNSGSFNFDLNSLSAWPTSSSTSQDNILDDLFSGYLGSTGGMDFSMLSHSPASISPVTHHTTPAAAKPRSSPMASSSSSSPSLLGSDPLFSTPRDTSSPDTEVHIEGKCPKSKAECEQHIASSGDSPFVPHNVRKSSDSVLGTMITCAGSGFPKTVKSDKNIEVLSAWRSIRADPQFKDTDINELCAEFTSKARCDGTKVVLEPQGVHSILESLSKKQ